MGPIFVLSNIQKNFQNNNNTHNNRSPGLEVEKYFSALDSCTKPNYLTKRATNQKVRNIYQLIVYNVYRKDFTFICLRVNRKGHNAELYNLVTGKTLTTWGAAKPIH